MQPCTRGQIDDGIARLSSIVDFAVLGMSPTIFLSSRYRKSVTTRRGPATTPDAFPISKGDSPLRHQNQPPDGSTPLRRRYVTRLP